MKPALVITNNHSGLAVAHGLGREGVPVVAVNHGADILGGSKYVVASWDVPDPQHHQDDFVAALIALSREYESCPLIPANDASLVALSVNKSTLSEHYVVACPDWEVTRLYIDKANTYRRAAEVGIPVPLTFYPDGPDDIEAIQEDVVFPCLVKPREGHLFQRVFGVKMFPVDDMAELQVGFRKACEAGLDIMIQDFIPGDDSCGVNYNSYTSPDRSPVEFTARKVRNAPPQYGSPRVVVSEWVPEAIDPGRRLLEEIGYFGFSCMEFKLDDRDGIYKLMEINGRHNRSAMLALRCGINFPWIEYQDIVRNESSKPAAFQEGVYWIDLLSDAKHSFKHRRFEKLGVGGYLRPYLRPHVFSVLNLRDVRPFLRRAFATLRQRFRR